MIQSLEKSFFSSLQKQIVDCEKCERLRQWCKKVAKEKRKSFIQDEYWGKPVPGFGDANAELVIVGLAPAAHGANRTGRIFTGDESGKWLYRALYKHGFSSKEQSLHVDDDLQLKNTYITCIVHCAPPDNKPSVKEVQTCQMYLVEEIKLFTHARVILALGGLAWNTLFQIFKSQGLWNSSRPKFGHGAKVHVGSYIIIGSYHPSQQNTFTKKLTEPMFDDIFVKIKNILKTSKPSSTINDL